MNMTNVLMSSYIRNSLVSYVQDYRTLCVQRQKEIKPKSAFKCITLPCNFNTSLRLQQSE